MSKILTVNRNSFQKFTATDIEKSPVKTIKHRRSLSVSGKTKISFMGFSFILMITIGFSGAFYLYQVNDLINKNYKVQSLKNQIQELKKTSQKNKIKQVELQSMYNIEKATQNFGLVHTDKVIYLETNGTVAMK